MTQLEQTLLDRACKYGNFEDTAKRSARIYNSMLNGAPDFVKDKDLSVYYEALHAIAVKIARLVTGQINDGDSWLDIAGYAMLVHQQIEAEQGAKSARHAADDDKAMIEEMYDEIIAEMKDDG